MRSLMSKLWNDDAGTVILEYLILGTFLSLLLIVGVNALGKAIDAELIELGNSILTFNQGYSVCNYSACCAQKDGGGATDKCDKITPSSSGSTLCDINVSACP